jgi:hypothetical protein
MPIQAVQRSIYRNFVQRPRINRALDSFGLRLNRLLESLHIKKRYATGLTRSKAILFVSSNPGERVNAERALQAISRPRALRAVADFENPKSPAFLAARQLLESNFSMFHETIGQRALTELERFALARIAINKNSRATSKHIQKYHLPASRRFEIAKIGAAMVFSGTSEFIENYQLTASQRFEVAKIAAANGGGGTSRFIQNYQLPASQHFEIAKIAVAKNGAGTSEFIENYQLTESQRFEFAKLVATQNGRGTSEFIQNYLLAESQRFEVAKLAAAQNGRGTSEFIQNYLLAESQRFEVAKLAAAQNSAGTSEFIQNYQLTKGQRFEVAKIAAAEPSDWMTCESLDNYRLFESQRLAVVKIALCHDIQMLRYLDRYYLEIKSFEIAGDFTKEDFISYAKKTLASMGLDPGLADHLYSDMGRRDAGVRLLSQLIQETPETLAAVPEPKEKNLTRYLLARLTGLEPTLLYGRKFSHDALGNFYEVCLDLQAGGRKVFFEGHAFAEVLFQDRSLKQLMTLLQSLDRMKNLLAGGFEQYRRAVIPSNITQENIAALTGKIDGDFLPRFQQLFLLAGEQPITMAQIKQLEELWGNLEVFFTLAARFRGNPDWEPELTLLAKVVAAVLNKTFHALKYEGDPADPEDREIAAAQLAPLKSEQARAGWRANYQRVGLFSSQGQASRTSEDELMGRSKKQLEQLALHLREEKFLEPLERTDRRELDGLKAKIKDAPKYSTIKGLDRTMVVSAGLELLNEAGDIGSYQAIISLFKGSAGALRLPQQIEADLKTLADLLKYRETGQEAIVFTTTADDPKLLLMTGSLVDASSCQDYRFGGYVQTLLGYVVDAGVKLALSYSLRERDFDSAQDYQEVKRLVQAGVQPEFIPARQRLKIGEIEIGLPKALKRRVIKLGNTGADTAGVRGEKEYAQNHFAEGSMDTQLAEVIAELAEKSQARQDENISIPPSRNPLGIYSDLAGGIQTEGYAI